MPTWPPAMQHSAGRSKRKRSTVIIGEFLRISLSYPAGPSVQGPAGGDLPQPAGFHLLQVTCCEALLKFGCLGYPQKHVACCHGCGQQSALHVVKSMGSRGILCAAWGLASLAMVATDPAVDAGITGTSSRRRSCARRARKPRSSASSPACRCFAAMFAVGLGGGH